MLVEPLQRLFLPIAARLLVLHHRLLPVLRRVMRHRISRPVKP
jgi:hypothetical protein